jgi:hypothetical protein
MLLDISFVQKGLIGSNSQIIAAGRVPSLHAPQESVLGTAAPV